MELAMRRGRKQRARGRRREAQAARRRKGSEDVRALAGPRPAPPAPSPDAPSASRETHRRAREAARPGGRRSGLGAQRGDPAAGTWRERRREQPAARGARPPTKGSLEAAPRLAGEAEVAALPGEVEPARADPRARQGAPGSGSYGNRLEQEGRNRPEPRHILVRPLETAGAAGAGAGPGAAPPRPAGLFLPPSAGPRLPAPPSSPRADEPSAARSRERERGRGRARSRRPAEAPRGAVFPARSCDLKRQRVAGPGRPRGTENAAVSAPAPGTEQAPGEKFVLRDRGRGA